MYEITGLLKHAEIDSFNDGCLPDTALSHNIDVDFKSDTIKGVIAKFAEFFDVDIKDVELDSCEELGRADLSRMENGDADSASQAELDAWRKGNCKLWHAIYSAQVEKVTREVVSLK